MTYLEHSCFLFHHGTITCLLVFRFANGAAPNTSQLPNCEYVAVWMDNPHTYPAPPNQKDDPSSSFSTMDRIFLRTTRVVEADEEIVVDYGNSYWNL
jgi:hypothetical protein